VAALQRLLMACWAGGAIGRDAATARRQRPRRMRTAGGRGGGRKRRAACQCRWAGPAAKKMAAGRAATCCS